MNYPSRKMVNGPEGHSGPEHAGPGSKLVSSLVSMARLPPHNAWRLTMPPRVLGKGLLPGVMEVTVPSQHAWKDRVSNLRGFFPKLKI